MVAVYAEHESLLRLATGVSGYDDDMPELWLGIAGRFIDATAQQIRSEQLNGLIPPSSAAARCRTSCRIRSGHQVA